ncbi:MAG: hypothetical protein QOJ38_190 [Solirubrobacterales bacterium]|jgi:anti-anti-sigma factor|nr:hypothetical protein [Solirubrobacterales bacterium]
MTSDLLEISIDRRPAGGGEAALVRVTGEVDLSNSAQLSGVLRSPVCGECQSVVLDLAEVPFMDSSGLQALLVAIGELGSKLALVVTPGSAVGRLFELTQVSGRLADYPSQEEALAALGANSPDADG